MSQMRYKETKKKPAAVIAVVIILIVIAIAAAVFIYFSNSNKQQPQSLETEPATETSVTEIVTEQSSRQTSSSVEQTTSDSDQQTQGEENTDNGESSKIVVPADSDTDSKFFSGEFSPYKAIDTETKNECSLKEVFGSSYSGGSMKFNSDGTFSDTLSISSVDSGAYILNNSTITATYTNDKNVTIAVVDWDGDTPAKLIINYGGYDVYFD